MNRNPLVSVVMPVYNAERYIREAIDSILTQTFSDFEFLIVDDGSTDHSVEIAHSYTDRRIRVLAETHRGLISSLNRGLALARGKYIARMDADDVSYPRRLARQIAYMESCADVVLVGCCARCIDTESRPIGNYVIPATGGRGLAAGLCTLNQFVHGSIAMRRDAALAVGGYRPQFRTAEDYDLWLRLGEIGSLGNIAAFLYQLRVHQTSKSAKEGRGLCKDYTMRAQRYALQRRLRGRDDLGYTTSQHRSREASSPMQPSLSIVALTDWAQICLWQRKVHLSVNALQAALTGQDDNACSWSVIAPTYLSKPYAREILSTIHHGSWVQLGHALTGRLSNYVVDMIKALQKACAYPNRG